MCFRSGQTVAVKFVRDRWIDRVAQCCGEEFVLGHRSKSLPVIACDKREAFAHGSDSDEAIRVSTSGKMDCFAALAMTRSHYPIASKSLTAFFDASVRQCRRSRGSTVERLAFDRRISTVG